MLDRSRAAWALVVIASVVILVTPALWNGFPLLQYDTGGYLAPWFEGKLEINRSVPYGLLLVAGQYPDFWPVLIVQAALTVWVLAVTLRVHKLGGPLYLLAAVAVLSLATTLPWLTAILLTDIFSGLGVLALYLVLLRDDALSRGERAGLLALAAVSAATHSATLLVLAGLVLVATLVWLIDRARIPYPRLLRAMSALVVSVLLVVAANGAVTGRIGWAPGGIALSFGRMLEDGIVKRYLDDRCPDATLRLCPDKDRLPKDADDFFWGGGVFDAFGRFEGMHEEMRRVAIEATLDYPWLQLKSIVRETALQLAMVETGAGVVNWIWNTYDTIKAHVPAAVPAMAAARQQRIGLSFDAINAFQVPLAWLAMALTPLIVFFAWRRPGFADIGDLGVAVMLGIAGNAAVFGILATAHNRYGARLVWLAGFVVLVALARRFPLKITRR